MASAIRCAPTTGATKLTSAMARATSGPSVTASSDAVPPRPALKMARSIGVAASAAASLGTKPALSLRSNISARVSAPRARHSFATPSRRVALRPHNRSVTPERASTRARAAPMPLEAPVIRMVFCPMEIRQPPPQCGKCFLPNQAMRGYGSAAFIKGIRALSAAVEIVPVRSKAHWHAFHHLPYRIYADDPNWVAPLLLERRFHFDPKHNPYFQHAKAEFFIARRGGEVVGRITAQVDRLHQERNRAASGHFGFIEAIDEQDEFNALLKAAEDWLRAQGMQRAIGPVSFSLWDQPGLLVDGFDTPPYVMLFFFRFFFVVRFSVVGFVL